ncbi:putative glycosyl hydrolase family 88 protein [Elsinoe australis]|uniref:Putative glycosyl hydrolase family 88 protein n=1 Tax=Elsinoe australis TaxID=40998 RepID=A0A4V6YAV8_9PEZI|nr:putative glycosyl hydrolase family 88 protein [Elsinoe australis]
MGFIVQPALQMDWELTGSHQSLQGLSNAAHALASRWSPKVGAIRSWDKAINYRYSFTDTKTDFLVIIDSMCNLDLLYTVGHRENDDELIEMATTHAHTVRKTILRDDFSSYHLVNFDPKTGNVKAKMTNQGFKDETCWSRGQAWAIMGFAKTFIWTKDTVFLDTAIRCADYFLGQLQESKCHHPMVPVWDFQAPQETPQEPLRDSSAGTIAANGLLLIHQGLLSLDASTSARNSNLAERHVIGQKPCAFGARGRRDRRRKRIRCHLAECDHEQ